MGAVYEVLDERTRHHRALKAMLPLLIEDSAMRARFELEARITGGVESDHLVNVLDAGVDDDTGIPFIVMEMLRGESLGALLKRARRLSALEVITYLYQAALALEKTHVAGIVHRDLKPENLFLTRRDDGTPCLKILDFGIAKLVAQTLPAVDTRPMMGTPFYMSPEQAKNDRRIDGRADVYALGHIAYTLLAGEPYWQETFLLHGSPYLLVSEILKGTPEPASERMARRGGPLLPAAFDAWFTRATAPQPDARFPRAIDAVLALADVLEAGPPSAWPQPLVRELPADPFELSDTGRSRMVDTGRNRMADTGRSRTSDTERLRRGGTDPGAASTIPVIDPMAARTETAVTSMRASRASHPPRSAQLRMAGMVGLLALAGAVLALRTAPRASDPEVPAPVPVPAVAQGSAPTSPEPGTAMPAAAAKAPDLQALPQHVAAPPVTPASTWHAPQGQRPKKDALGAKDAKSAKSANPPALDAGVEAGADADEGEDTVYESPTATATVSAPKIGAPDGGASAEPVPPAASQAPPALPPTASASAGSFLP
jgi:serine/threonine protein kinase